jgi:hypothetical protein
VDEDLGVIRVQYGSPGEINLITTLATQAPQIVQYLLFVFLLIHCFPNFVQRISATYRKWIEDKHHAEMIRRRTERSRLIHEFFMERLRQTINDQIDEDKKDEVLQRISEIDNATSQIGEADIVDPVPLLQQTFDAMASLGRYEASGRLRLPTPKRLTTVRKESNQASDR